MASLPQQPWTPLPHFTAGVLIGVSESELTLQLPDGFHPPTIPVRLNSNTQICRHHCSASWSDLRLGDRITASTYQGSDGIRVANWVDANLISGFGIVTAVSPTTVTITPTKNYGTVIRDLLVESHTTIQLANGTKAQGSTQGITVGMYVHFTGTMDTPSMEAQAVWAMMINQLETNSTQMPPASSGAGTTSGY